MKKSGHTIMTAALLSAALVMQGELNHLTNVSYATEETNLSPSERMNLMAGVYGPPPAKTTALSETPSETTEMTETTEVTETSETRLVPVTEPEEEYTPPKFYITVPVYGCPVAGDVNNDGRINIVDFTVLKNIVSGEHYELMGADLNSDGNIDAEDLKMFEHFFLGITNDPTEKADVPEEKPVTTTVTEQKPEPVTSDAATEAVTTPYVKPTVMGTVYGPPPAYYNNH